MPNNNHDQIREILQDKPKLLASYNTLVKIEEGLQHEVAELNQPETQSSEAQLALTLIQELEKNFEEKVENSGNDLELALELELAIVKLLGTYLEKQNYLSDAERDQIVNSINNIVDNNQSLQESFSEYVAETADLELSIFEEPSTPSTVDSSNSSGSVLMNDESRLNLYLDKLKPELISQLNELGIDERYVILENSDDIVLCLKALPPPNEKNIREQLAVYLIFTKLDEEIAALNKKIESCTKNYLEQTKKQLEELRQQLFCDFQKTGNLETLVSELQDNNDLLWELHFSATERSLIQKSITNENGNSHSYPSSRILRETHEYNSDDTTPKIANKTFSSTDIKYAGIVLMKTGAVTIIGGFLGGPLALPMMAVGAAAVIAGAAMVAAGFCQDSYQYDSASQLDLSKNPVNLPRIGSFEFSIFKSSAPKQTAEKDAISKLSDIWSRVTGGHGKKP